MAGVPLLLLDLDNTVADRDASCRYWVERKLTDWASHDAHSRSFLFRLDDGGVRPRSDFLQRAKQHFSVDESVEALLSEYRRLSLSGLPPLDPSVASRLRAARAAGWKVAIVSSGEGEHQHAKVEQLGLAPLIDACVISGAVGVRKPDPRIFELAARRCGNPAGPAWMIGDAEVDVPGAARAGIGSVWLDRGRRWARSDVRPDRIARDASEAIDLAAVIG